MLIQYVIVDFVPCVMRRDNGFLRLNKEKNHA